MRVSLQDARFASQIMDTTNAFPVEEISKAKI